MTAAVLALALVAGAAGTAAPLISDLAGTAPPPRADSISSNDRAPLAAALAAGPAMLSQDGPTHLLIVVGLGGDDVYRGTFHEWATRLRDAALAAGVADERLVYLGEDPELDPPVIAGRSTRDNVAAALARLAQEAGPRDRILLVLIGHGTSSGSESRFNLPGPDLTAANLVALLDAFTTQQVAVVNTASSSGDFVAALSGPGRVVITATRDARQYDQTVFPRYFVEAFGADVADLDKNGGVSLLEAYRYATREVARHYESAGSMRTETAQLDDNGDGLGSHEPDPGEADGALARAFFLAGGGAAAPLGEAGAADPELRALLDEKRELERRIEELKRIKDSLDPQMYLEELEGLLVELARVDVKIRDAGGAERRR